MANLNVQSEIYLDVRQKNIQKTVIAHQYDKKSRYILAHIIDDGEPIDVSEYTLDFKVHTQDDRAILDDTVTKQSEVGDVIIELSESLLCSAGKHTAELLIFSNTQRLTTMSFNIVVEGSVYPDDRVVSSDEFSALTTALTKVDHAVELAEELEILEVEWSENEAQRASNEEDRISAEQSRVSAEADRVQNESDRADAESDRVDAEAARVTAELGRVDAESDRVTAESGRYDAEQIRVSNENTRISNENARVTAEQSRVTAETGRVEAEAVRETNTTEAIGRIDEGLADVQDAVEEASTAAEGANTAKEAAEAETAIQIANNTRAEELIGQMEDIVDDFRYVTKNQLGIASTDLVTGVATLDEYAKLDPTQFPYDIATSEEVTDYIDEYFENLN